VRSAAFVALLAALGCSGPIAPPSEGKDRDGAARALVLRKRALGVMGTSLVIEVLGEDEAELERGIDAAVAELRRVEDMMTSWRASPLTRLNDAAGRGPRRVPPELAHLVTESKRIGALTDGAFDITFAGVGKLWDFKARPPVVPSREQIARALKVVDYRRIAVDGDASTVALPAGMRIGLGGIAKGYGVDRAMQVLIDRGIRHAFVNAGGDLKALGRKHGKSWNIAITHPRDRERVLAVIPVANRCVVTSGDYERFFVHEGRRYHHILDPRTGFPSTGCMSATVVGPSAAFCDALATACCVLDPKRALSIVESLDGVEALVVGMDGDVQLSSGLQER